jgi:hypothetical protein
MPRVPRPLLRWSGHGAQVVRGMARAHRYKQPGYSSRINGRSIFTLDTGHAKALELAALCSTTTTQDLLPTLPIFATKSARAHCQEHLPIR